MTIKTKIAGTMLGSIFAASLILSGAYYYSEKERGEKEVDKRLLNWARHARGSLPADYHDRITGPSSVSKAEFDRIVDTNDKRCRDMDLQYIWSVLVLDAGKIVFTTSTSPSHDIRKQDYARFFEVHKDPGAFSEALAAMRPHYSTFRNEWGWGRMVLVPERDAKGRVFMFGASVSVEGMLAARKRLALTSAGITAALLLCGLFYSFFLAGFLSRPIVQLSTMADDIANGNFSRTARLKGASELASLSDSINRMRDTIKQKMEALQESEKKFRGFFDLNPIPLCYISGDGVIRQLNSQFTSTLGYALDDIPTLADLWLRAYPDPGYRKWAIKTWEDGLAAGATAGRLVTPVEYRVTRKDGGVRHVIISGIAIGSDFLATFIDITERNSVEEELARHRAHLEELVKARTAALELVNQDLETFSFSVAHDLRAPMRRISSFIELMAEETGDRLTGESRRYLERISVAAAGATKLIDALLNFSRTGKIELRLAEMDLDEAADEVIAELRAAPGGDRPQFKRTPLGRVRADYGMMKAVLNNLLGNAVKFTSKTESPVIEISRLAGTAKESVFRVKDNGAGFDKRYADKLFGVFSRLHTETEFEGSGIGLANVKRIITRHGGRVWAEGEAGKGAAFFFSLPKQEAPDGRA